MPARSRPLLLPADEATYSLAHADAALFAGPLGNLHHYWADRGQPILGSRYRMVPLTALWTTMSTIYQIGDGGAQDLNCIYIQPIWAIGGLRQVPCRIEWRVTTQTTGGAGVVTSGPWIDTFPAQELGSRGNSYQFAYPNLPYNGVPEQISQEQRHVPLPVAGSTYLIIQARLLSSWAGQLAWYRGAEAWSAREEGEV